MSRFPLDHLMEGAKETDVVILVMGPTKAGKSYFLNQLLPETVDPFKVGTKLVSCTANVSSRILPQAPPGHPLNEVPHQRRIVLVDTPGFDDTYMGDEEVLGRISEWLAKSYREGMLVGGVVYIHDITRISPTSKSFNIFSKLCGEDAMDQVAIVTTKWDRLDTLKQGEDAEAQLCDTPWKSALGAGARLCRLQPSGRDDRLSPLHIDPWDIIDLVIATVGARQIEDRILHIQDEVINSNLPLTETDAGRELEMSLTKLLKKAKDLRTRIREEARAGRATDLLRERRAEVDKIIAQVEALRPPGLATRVKLWAQGFSWR